MKGLIALLALSCLFAVAAGATPPGEAAQARQTQAPISWVQKAGRVLAVLVALYAALLVLVLVLEDRFVYYPDRYPVGEWTAHGLTVEDCFFETEDGIRLHAWWQEGTGSGAAPVLLFFHGNAGNITHRADNLHLLAGTTLSVLIVDYRGYGKSQGRPSEKGLYLDGEAAYRYLTDERGIEPRRIISFGRSLGATVALHVALKHRVAGLIMEGAFTNARAMARSVMPILPVGPFIRSRLDNIGRVGELKAPLMVIHGDRDETVPFRQGKEVFEAAPEPKEFYRVEGAGHNDTYVEGGEQYLRTLLEFCESCVRGSD